MNYLIDVMACSFMVIFELFVVVFSMAMIQLFVYQLTGFSIYNYLYKIFMLEVKKGGIANGK